MTDYAPVRCPNIHRPGRQIPLHDGTSATGEFRCEVCGTVYDATREEE